MAKTWSNTKRIDEQSAAQKAQNRPSSFTAFLALLVLLIVFFIGLMTFVTIYAEQHPPTVKYQSTTDQPKD